MLVNLTPHVIVAILASGDKLTLPPSGKVARVSIASGVIGNLDGVPLARVVMGDIDGIPAPEEGTIFIVSAIVRGATTRSDVASPGDLVRDANGQPIGCRSLIVN